MPATEAAPVRPVADEAAISQDVLLPKGDGNGAGGALSDERIQEIRARLSEGFYDREVITEAIMKGVLAQFPELLPG